MATIGMPLAIDFEDSEFAIPRDRLRAAKHTVVVIGVNAGERLRGKRGEEYAAVDRGIDAAKPEEYDALVIAGGYSPDHLRGDSRMVDFVRRFAELSRPIAAVCHGPQLLIEADLVRDRRLTSWPTVKRDLENAGATWVDAEVCVDGDLITSRKPADLEAFSRAIITRLARRAIA